MADTEDKSSTTLIGVDSAQNGKGFLCDRCVSVDFSLDKFIVSKPTAMVDMVQNRYSYESRKSNDNFRLNSGASLKNFSTLRDLQDRRDVCAFCDLAFRAIERYSGSTAVDDTTSCSLRWEVHGREADSQSVFVNCTRRIRLTWNEKTGNTQEVYVIYVAPRDILRPNSDATSRWERETRFLGRDFGDQKEKQALIKSWLDLCIHEHSDECRDTHGTRVEFRKLIEETYFGVIDVADMQLKSLPIGNDRHPEPYVALSYVWGRKSHDDPPYVTKRANIMTHILHGGLETAWEKLPRTIQDSILLVSRLGYRYLWIDSLCIVQDSNSSWQLNAQAMHLVYGHALFTICAADGRDCSSGLRAAQPILRALGPVSHGNQVPGAASRDVDDPRPICADVGDRLRLMVTRPLEAMISDSEWDTRAWTFQERILSRRCLIFAEGRVFFQCRTTCMSQDIYSDGNSKGWSLDRANSPLRTLRELQQRPLWFYLMYIRMYTGRQLTKPRDVLAAFKGVAWLLEEYMSARSLFGLPTSHFDLAVLWSPLEAVRRRQPRAPSGSGASCVQDALGNCICKVEQESFGGTDFPSWSWSGWMGGRIEYQSSMLEGCLLDVREWLTHHTWIQWHIRDETGHLQPLWDMISHKSIIYGPERSVDAKVDERWMGYPGMKHHPVSVRERVYDELEERESDIRVRLRRRRSPSPAIYRSGLPSPSEFHGLRRDIIRSPSPQLQKPKAPPDGRLVQIGDFLRRVLEVLGVFRLWWWLWKGGNRRDSRRQPRGRSRSPFQSRSSYPPIPRRRSVSPPRSRAYSRSLSRSRSRSSGRLRRRIRINIPGVIDRRSCSYSSYSPYSPPRISPRRSAFARPRSRSRSPDDNRRDRTPSRESNSCRITHERVNNQAYVVNRRSRFEKSHRTTDERSGPTEDKYGRSIRTDVSAMYDEEEAMFQAILPDNPFGVIRDKLFVPPSDRLRSPTGMGKESRMAYMPILQFQTWRTELHVTIRDSNAESTVKPTNTGLCQCDILDKTGDWCGAIVLDDEWIRVRQGNIFQFIAISDAKCFTQEECPVWTYYIPKERDESEWDLYFVLLLQRNMERGVWERVGLGKAFQAAFRDRSWAEIKLG
ncbi:hypothetical protein ACJZ2D_016157 [Fusarium nematophilum]